MSFFRLRNRQNPLQGIIAERELARMEAGLPLHPSKKPGTAQKRGGRSGRARGSTRSRGSTQATGGSNLRGLIDGSDASHVPIQQIISSGTINRRREEEKEEEEPLSKPSRFSIRKNVFFDSVALIDNEGDLSERFNFADFWEYQTKKAQHYAEERGYTLYLIKAEADIKYGAKNRPEHHKLPVLGPEDWESIIRTVKYYLE